MMTESEICASYREAKNKQKQVGILADLNVCSKEKIIRILTDNGMEPAGDVPKKQTMIWLPEQVEQLLALRAEGKTYKQIASAMKLDERQVQNKLVRLAKERRKRQDSPELPTVREPGRHLAPQSMVGAMKLLMAIAAERLAAGEIIGCGANNDEAVASVLFDAGGARYRLRLEELR